MESPCQKIVWDVLPAIRASRKNRVSRAPDRIQRQDAGVFRQGTDGRCCYGTMTGSQREWNVLCNNCDNLWVVI